MTRDRLIERLRGLDPATPEDIAEASREAHELRRAILAEPVDELAIRRRARRRRVGVAVAAVAVAVALLVPLILLLPLGDDGSTTIGTTPSVTPRPATSTSTSTATATPEPPGPGASAPIEVAQPVPRATVTSPVTITGTADVFEATVSVRIQDATNNTIAETFTTATCGSGCRGDFSVDVPYSVGAEQPGVIEVFEVSAEDGSRTHVVRIPVTLTPPGEDPVAAAVEGVWSDANDDPVSDGSFSDGPLVLSISEGPDHCGWTSVTFMSIAWPPGSASGSGGRDRQYLRDPSGVLSESTAGPLAPSATLPGDAAYTGLHRGDWQLWVAPSDADAAVYIVNADPTAGGVVERWPRVTTPIGCD